MLWTGNAGGMLFGVSGLLLLLLFLDWESISIRKYHLSAVGWRHAFRSGLLLFYCYYYYCTEATNLDVSRGVLGHGSLWRSQDCRDKQDAGHISVQQARGRAAVFPKQLLVKLRRTLHDGAGAQGHNKHHQDPTGAGNPGRARSRPGHLHSSATSTN